MQVYEGNLRITPSFVYLVVGGKEYTLPLTIRNGKFVRYNHPGSIREVRSYKDYPEEGYFLYFPELGAEREVFVKVSRVESVIQTKPLKEKETLKVYETPEQTVELFILHWLKTLKNNMEEVLKLRGQTQLYTKLNQVNIKDFYQHIRENWQEYEKAFEGLLTRPPRLVLFDPQAGSGEAFFKVAKKYGIEDALLLGTEIREIKSDNPNYGVQTGVDYLAYYSELYRRLSRKESTSDHVVLDPNAKRDQELTEIAHKHGIYYTDLIRAYAFVPRLVNPPYIAQGKHPILYSTFANEPPLVIYNNTPYSGYAYVVLSHTHLSDARTYYRFHEKMEMSYEQVGYKHSVPERYVVGVVSNDRAMRNINDDTIAFFHSLELVTKASEALKEMVKNIAEGARRVMKQIDETTVEGLLEDFSVELDARRNQEVFPAIDQIGREGIGFYTYEEVINNPLLIELYRQKTPHLYNLVKTMARERDDVVRELKPREFNLMDERGLGILKYAGLPLIYPLDEKVYDAVVELLSEEEAKRFKKLVEGLKDEKLEIWLKSGENVMAYDDGLVAFGRHTHVCLCSSDSRVHALLPIDPLKFLKKVNNINLQTYQEEKDFLPFVKQIIKQYALHAQEGAKLVFTEEELKLIDSRSWGNSKKDFRQFCYDLYINQKLEGRFIKDRILKDQFFQVLRGHIVSRLSGMGETDINEVLSLIHRLERAYKENFVYFFSNFSEVKVEEFAQKHTEGKPVLEWIEKKIEATKLSEEAKAEAKAEIMNALESYRVEVMQEDPLILRKAVVQYVVAQSLLKLVEGIEKQTEEEGKIPEEKLRELYQLFRKHLQEHLGFFDYQVDFALNSSYGMQVKDKNVLLGWQQRTGKTRAALLSLLFQSFTTQQPTDFFVRSQNLIDILVQYIDAMPLFAGFVKVGVGQTNREQMGIKEEFLIHHPHPDFVYPNPFYGTGERGSIFFGKGTTVKKLLEDNAYAKIEYYINNPDPELLEYAKDKVYGRLLEMEGYSKQALQGVVCYLAQLDKQGLLDLKDTRAWNTWLEKVKEEGKELEKSRNLLSESKVLINLLSREVFYNSINGLMPQSKKEIGHGADVYANVETEVVPARLNSKYYLLTPKLVRYIKSREPELLKEECTFVGVLAGEDLYATKNPEVIREFIERERLRETLGYTVVRADYFLRVFADEGRVKRNTLENYGFSLENLNGYMRVPEKLPYYVRQGGNIENYQPAEERNFVETYIRIENGNLITEYRYEPQEDNRIYKASEVNARPVMTSLKAYEGRVTGHDEMDGTVDREREMSQNRIVLASLARVGKVLQLSGTADPFGYLITGMELDKITYYQNLIESIVNMKEVRDNVFEGFFEHLARFVYYLNLKGDREAIEKLVFTLTNESLSIEERLLRVIDMFEQHNFYQPHMQVAFDAVLAVARKRDDEEENIPLSRLKKFFNALVQERKKTRAYSYLSFIHMLEKALDRAKFTYKFPSRDFVSVANLALTDKHDVTLGNRKSFKGDEGTRLVLKETHLAEVFKHYKKTKTWLVREPEVSGFRVEGDPEVIRFLWKKTFPRSLREAYDLLNKEAKKIRELREDLKLIVSAFQDLFASEKLNVPELYKSAKTKDDDLKSMVDLFITHKELASKDIRKQKLMYEFLEALSEMKVEVLKEKTGKRKNKEVLDEQEERKLYRIKIDFLGKEWAVELPAESFYHPVDPKNYQPLFEWNFNLRLNVGEGRGWFKELFKDGKAEYFIDFNPVFGDFGSVVDALSNRSFIKEYERTAREKINTFITTERVPTLIVALGDLLKALYENKQGRVHVLVLETDSRIREFLNRINIDFLASKGIYVERIPSSSKLTIEAEKLVRSGRQVYVVANTTAVARGTDLSMLDEIILVGRVLGNEGLQVLSRLEHAAKTGTKYMFLGVDGAHRYYTFGEHVKPIPNTTLLSNINTVNRKYQEEVKHTGESVQHQLERGVIIPLSQQAQKVLETKQKLAIGL